MSRRSAPVYWRTGFGPQAPPTPCPDCGGALSVDTAAERVDPDGATTLCVVAFCCACEFAHELPIVPFKPAQIRRG